MSSITADNVEIYKNAVLKMSNDMDANIKVCKLIVMNFITKIYFILEYVHDNGQSRRGLANDEICSKSIN